MWLLYKLAHLTIKLTLAYTPWSTPCSVVFLFLGVGDGIINCILLYVRFFEVFFHWKSLKTSTHEVFYRKSLSTSRIFFELLPAKYWSKTALGSFPMWRHFECKPLSMTCRVCHVAHSVFRYFLVRVGGLMAQGSGTAVEFECTIAIW